MGILVLPFGLEQVESLNVNIARINLSEKILMSLWRKRNEKKPKTNITKKIKINIIPLYIVRYTKKHPSCF